MTRSQAALLALLLVTMLLVWGFVAVLLVYPAPSIPATLSPPETPVLASNPQRFIPDLPATWTITPTPLPFPTPTHTLPTFTPTPIALSHPQRPTPLFLEPSYHHPSQTISIPTAVSPLTIPEDAITILLLGSDQRPGWDNWRTDAIQYVVVYPDPVRPAVSILSIPRDLYVYLPGLWLSRINLAHLYGELYQYEGGGLGLLNQTLLYNLGITADYHVKIDFDGLIGLVDALGGIDVPVHCRLYDYWPYPNEQGEYYAITMEPGIHHMDGELALWYSRSRKTTSVFSRERRQQQVLEAMWRKAKEAHLLETAPVLYEQAQSLLETDLGLAQVLPLAVTAARLEPVDVRRYNISGYDVFPYTTPYGGGVFLPNWERVQPIIAAVLAPPADSRAAQDTVWVEVWNGTERADLDRLAADRLYEAGFLPSVAPADRHDYPQTQIIFFGSTAKGSRLAELQSLFRVSDRNVTYAPDPNAPASLRLIVGADYISCSNR